MCARSCASDHDGICGCLCEMVTGTGGGGNRSGAVGVRVCMCGAHHNVHDDEGSCT